MAEASDAAWRTFKAGDLEGGRSALLALAAEAPEDFLTRLRLGRILAFRREAEAESHLRAALRLRPDDLTALLVLADLLARERRLNEAQGLYERALEADPASRPALEGLAKMHVRQRRFQDAYAVYMRALEAHPRDAKLHAKAAHALSIHALRLAEAAAELDPNLPDAQSAKAVALKAQGRLEEAAEVLGAQLALRPADTALRNELAILRGLAGGAPQRRRPSIFPRHIRTAAEFEDAIRRSVIAGAAPDAPILTPASKVITLGSCFAEHLALTLRERGVDVFFQKRSENFDNLHATRLYVASLAGGDGRDAYTFFPKDGPRQIQIERFGAAGAVILSLGVSAAYFDRKSGEPLMPGVGAGQSMLAASAEFRMLSVDENLALLREVIAGLRRLSPEAAIVLTLSPVPLAATFDRLSAVQADAVSKSTLRVAIERFMSEAPPGVHYWPSYEIVRWLGVYAPAALGPVFGAEDGMTRHVSAWIVRLIMRLFLESFGQGFGDAGPAGAQAILDAGTAAAGGGAEIPS